ncbi:MAG: sulfate adenylyltransferase subunit CysD [Pseudomonadota bacterium]|nr:sulfate adenylyltransferase subunit CysD [Pseudomonadota bacterium]
MSNLSHLDKLEAESIYIIREVVACFERPVLLYSIGKDSAVMLHLAIKAFEPGPVPFKLLHVDTTWKFKEMIDFRDKVAKNFGLSLIVHVNKEGLQRGIGPISHGSKIHTNIMKTEALKQALDLHLFDAAFGGARRDEEKSRSKERIFSFRNKNHAWNPKNQRPELWSHFNTQINEGETVRVFPLSNWTEIDIWSYIKLRNIEVVSLYFSRVRPVVSRNDQLILVDDKRLAIRKDEKIEKKKVRFRTLGCYPLTGAVESEASTIDQIIKEIEISDFSERGGRLIDRDQIGSMEKKKQEGYF